MTPQQTVLTWLKDAHAMEAGAVKTLEQHAKAAEAYPEVQARLYQHAEETHHHAEQIKTCLERLGGHPSTAKEAIGSALGKVTGLANLPAKDTVVKNALGDYAAENFEIACYKSLIAAAEQVEDPATVQVCREILAEEEEMAAWLNSRIAAITQQFLEQKTSEPHESTSASTLSKTQGALQTLGAQSQGIVKSEGIRNAAVITSVIMAGVGAGFLLTQLLDSRPKPKRPAARYRPIGDMNTSYAPGRFQGVQGDKANPYVAPVGNLSSQEPQAAVLWSGTEEVDADSIGDGDYETYEVDFRKHYGETSTTNKPSFEASEPAYRYGYSLANDVRYQGRGWSDLETDAQRDWEAQNQGSWIDFRGPIQHAWESVRDRQKADLQS